MDKALTNVKYMNRSCLVLLQNEWDVFCDGSYPSNATINDLCKVILLYGSEK